MFNHFHVFRSFLKGLGKNPTIYSNLSLKKDKWVLLASLFFTIANGLVPAITSVLTGRVFGILTDFSNGKDLSDLHAQLTLRSMALLALGAGALVVTCISISCWMNIGERQGMRLRQKLLLTYMNSSIEYFEQTENILGDFTQLNRCVEELRSSSAEASAIISQNTVATCALIGVSFYYSWSLTLIILCSTPILVAIAFYFASKVHIYTAFENTESGLAAQVITWSMSSIQFVKLYCTEINELDRFRKHVQASNDYFIKSCLYAAANAGTLRFLSLAMFVQGFWFGSSMIRKGKLSINDVITCFHSCLMLGSIINNSLHQILFLQKGEVALNKLNGFITNGDTNELKRSEQVGFHELHDIVFTNVSFNYPSRPMEKALQNINITLHSGQTTFIVGKSGSGKSTLSNILLKFYEAYNGSIKVGEHEITNLDANYLRKNILLVEQTCFIFNDTIRNNILLGNRKAETNDLKSSDLNVILDEACKFASLNRMIEDLPDGVDTRVGKDGINLSGGQKQRIALARAFVIDPPVLILDESFSAVDLYQRQLLTAKLRKWRTGKTTIILTHDLNQIGLHDFLYLMQDGNVKEHGLKEELLVKPNSLFARLCKIQDSMKNTEGYNTKEVINQHSKTVTIDNSDKESEFPVNEYEITNTGIDIAENKFDIVTQTSTKSSEDISSFDNSIPTKLELNKTANSQTMSITKIIARILKDIRYKKILGSGLSSAILAGAANPIFSYTFSYLLNGIVPLHTGVGSPGYLLRWSMTVLGVAFGDGLFNFLRQSLLGFCSEYWIMDLRNDTMRKIMTKRLSWFLKGQNQTSEISALLLNDLRDLRSLVSEFLSAICTFVTISVIGLIWSLVSGWKLSLVCISLFPLIILFSAIYGSVLQKYETDYKTSVAQLENCLFEVFVGVKTIRCLQVESHFQRMYSGLEKKMSDIALKRSVATGLGIGVINSLTYCIQGILYYYGLKLVLEFEYSTHKLFETFTLLLFTIVTCTDLANQIPDISRGQRAARWTFRILDEDEPMENVVTQDSGSYLIEKLPVGKPIISIKNLTFGYSEYTLFNNLSLDLHEDEVVAIVGESGVGKSTLAYILTNLYETPSSTVFIEGTDVNDWDLHSLRRHIAVVEQKPTLFDSTVRNNLLYGNDRDIPDAEIYYYLKTVGISDFVNSLERGLDSYIDVTLVSGGQAQRLAICRALLRHPQILIFDEPTSALDAANSQIIYEVITKKNLARLTIVITHNEKLMKLCDEVAVIGDGSVKEKGAFENLYDRGLYLYQLVNNSGPEI